MISPKRYDRIAFVASAGTEAQLALEQLVELYGNHDPAEADVVVLDHVFGAPTISVSDTP